MTDTPNVTDERLREILAGCQGAHAGPWEVHDRLVRTVEPGRCIARLDWHVRDEIDDVDAAHIARLDPQTVSALVSEVLASRAAPDIAELAAKLSGEQTTEILIPEALRALAHHVAEGNTISQGAGMLWIGVLLKDRLEKIAALEAQAATIAARDARISMLEMALKPFADFGAIMLPVDAGDNSPWVTAPDATPVKDVGPYGFSFGMFRRAAALTTEAKDA